MRLCVFARLCMFGFSAFWPDSSALKINQKTNQPLNGMNVRRTLLSI